MARGAAALERQSKAVALRLAGLGYQEIADQLAYPSRTHAYADVEDAITLRAQDGARSLDALREVELMRLDRLQAAAWAKALTGDYKSIELSLKIVDRRCKLLGLDAPERIEVVTLEWLESQIRTLESDIAARGPAGALAAIEAAPD